MAEQEQWVIWNGSLGVVDAVLLGSVEVSIDGGRCAFLKAPYDMVGPFSLDELETRGFIDFAACVVMSRWRWQRDQTELRREAHEKRRELNERLQERFRASRGPFGENPTQRQGLRRRDEREYRAMFNLPLGGALRASEINAAFRKLAKSAHPDAGGSHAAFIRISEARDALLELAS
jgi:hypothetical protein